MTYTSANMIARVERRLTEDGACYAVEARIDGVSWTDVLIFQCIGEDTLAFVIACREANGIDHEITSCAEEGIACSFCADGLPIEHGDNPEPPEQIDHECQCGWSEDCPSDPY